MRHLEYFNTMMLSLEQRNSMSQTIISKPGIKHSIISMNILNKLLPNSPTKKLLKKFLNLSTATGMRLPIHVKQFITL